ncbi:MAG: site-specific integrase [Pirellulaceae bacterium]
MFNQLYTAPVALARHCSGPMLKERRVFLKHLADQGYTLSGLREKANHLLVIARMLGMASRPRKSLTLAEVKRKTGNERCYYSLAVQWLQFMGRLQPQPAPLTPWAKKMQAFADYMEHEAELSPRTIYNRCWWVRKFFDRLRVKGSSLQEITPQQIDMAIQKVGEPGGYSRVTVHTCATALRAFFHFANPCTCRFRTTGRMPYVMPVRRGCWPPVCLSMRLGTNWGTRTPEVREFMPRSTSPVFVRLQISTWEVSYEPPTPDRAVHLLSTVTWIVVQ